MITGLRGSVPEISSKANKPASQRNQGATLRPPGWVQTLALQRRSQPACADRLVLSNSVEDRF